jgi:hypothetical protein
MMRRLRALHSNCDFPTGLMQNFKNAFIKSIVVFVHRNVLRLFLLLFSGLMDVFISENVGYVLWLMEWVVKKRKWSDGR